MTTTDKIIQKYLNFGGKRYYQEFATFHLEVIHAKEKTQPGTLEYHCLEYIGKKLVLGVALCHKYGGHATFDISDTEDSIKLGYKPYDKAKKGRDLGKVVDSGDVPEDGNADLYWGREKIKLVFEPEDEKVRHGAKLPPSYKFGNVRYIENYYSLRGIEFGNWLSQQDRANYMAALGLALYDFHTALGFSPKHMGIKEKLTVSFGARGRGTATAHFTPSNFVINLTRYSRPPKVKARPGNYERVKLLLTDGGLGAYAHEFAHALDFYAGMYIEKSPSGAISGGKSTDPDPHKPPFAKGSLRALMETLLNKIIWKNKSTHSDYYKRLKKATKGKYYFMRAELFARAFEVYIQSKLAKKGYYNIFLNEKKYDTSYYLTTAELKKVERDFDALIAAIKKHL